MAALRLIISGRVQGVEFRAFVAHLAGRRGVKGWIRNRRDGTVEALLIGDEAGLAEMDTACRRGPPLASVRSVERQPAEDDGSTEFREAPTA
ncbi:MAG: acylphosphatase [Roseiarcus sp.]